MIPIPGMKYAIVALLLSTTVMYGLWQREKVNSKGLENANAILASNVVDLTAGLERQLETIKGHNKITHANNEITRSLYSEMDGIRQESFKFQQELEERRANEFNNALAEPFRSGNIARGNLNKLLCAFASKDTNCHDPNTTRSSDPPTPNSTVDDDPSGTDTIES